jgi:hypothetical protein
MLGLAADPTLGNRPSNCNVSALGRWRTTRRLHAQARLGGFGLGLVKTLSSIYPGYAPTFTGTVIGGIWGLVCGFVCGAVIALIYNYLQGLCAQSD